MNRSLSDEELVFHCFFCSRTLQAVFCVWSAEIAECFLSSISGFLKQLLGFL